MSFHNRISFTTFDTKTNCFSWISLLNITQQRVYWVSSLPLVIIKYNKYEKKTYPTMVIWAIKQSIFLLKHLAVLD